VPAPVFEFGDFRLDCTRFELQRAGRILKLERKPMDLLILLAAREGDLVTRAEIAGRLWGSEVFVDTEHGINTAIRKVRQVLRDDPDQPRFVHTVMGRGYRFIGPLVEVHPPLPTEDNLQATDSSQPAIPDSTRADSSKNELRVSSGLRRHLWLTLGVLAALVLIAATLRAHWSREKLARGAAPNIRSLAVLPLDNLSGGPAQNYFADGMTEELTTMLAKDSTLRVVSRTSAMQYKGGSPSICTSGQTAAIATPTMWSRCPPRPPRLSQNSSATSGPTLLTQIAPCLSRRPPAM
jgi:DNA-binding winged helix-turn-helix (wHTH) protein